MSKIGIKIDRTREGNENLFVINDGEWVSKTTDCRKLLNKLKGDKTNNVALVLSLIETGYLFILIKGLCDRENDNLTAFIHVPYDTKIEGRKLCDIIENVKGKIKEGNLAEAEDLKKLVEEDCPTEERFNCEQCSSLSAEDAYIRVGGDFKLYELIDNKRLHQENYGKYKYVFFLENDDLSCAEDVNELKTEELKKKVEVKVVSNNKFKAYYNDKEFEKGYFTEGKTITIIWKREGYKHIQDPYTVGGNNEIEVPKDKIEKHILICIKDEKKNSIDIEGSSLIIKINGKEIENSAKIPLPEDDLEKKLKVEIVDKKNRYEKYNKEVQCNNDRIDITLENRKVDVSVTFKNNKKESVLILEKKMSVAEFEKYDVEKNIKYYKGKKNGNSEIEYTPEKLSLFDKKKKIVCAILSLCFFVAGIYGGYEYWSWEEKQEEGTMKEKRDEMVELLKKQKWNKKEMEKHEKLKGLWEAMNKYDFEEIKKHSELYSLSENSKKVIEASFKFKGVKKNGFYNSEKSEDITIDKWLAVVERTENVIPQPKPSPDKTDKTQKQPKKGSGTPKEKKEKGKNADNGAEQVIEQGDM